jgi:hypothetical protein
MDSRTNKKIAKSSIKESPSIFYWVAAALEVVVAGTVIVAVLYALFPFKFL